MLSNHIILMREFYVETTKTDYPDEVVSAGQLLRMLDSDAREISNLCQKACLKPKKDGFGNIYFSKTDVDVLRKVKELYAYNKKIQDEKLTPKNEEAPSKELKFKGLKAFNKKEEKDTPKVENFLQNETVFEKEKALPVQISQSNSVMKKIDLMENNIISKMTSVLSEKLDGLDEVIVELIKAKTENETLRQKINTLNKENFALKTENASFKPVGLGFYIKKSTDDFTV